MRCSRITALRVALSVAFSIGLFFTDVCPAHGDEPAKSEDQWIAELLLATLSMDAEQKASLLLESRKAYPKSANMAYWRGRVLAFDNNTSAFLKEMSGIMGSLSRESIQQATNEADADQAKRSAGMGILFAQSERLLDQRMAELGLKGDVDISDAAFFEAISLDPKFTAAWARLVCSSNTKVALAAADSWAAMETDNALPHFAKACIVAGSVAEPWTEADSRSILAALREGNQKSGCHLPDDPWPHDFELRFPDDEKVYGKDHGKPISPRVLRIAVESWFEGIESLSDTPLSTSALRGIGDSIMRNGSRLPPKTEVDLLTEYAGLANRMLRSNRLLYAIGSINERPLRRLEMIAVDHGDFVNARNVEQMRQEFRRVMRMIAEDYRKAKQETDRDIDGRAQKIMEQVDLNLSLPQLQLSQNTERSIIASETARLPSDWVRIDVFVSADGVEMVRRSNQVLPQPMPQHDALEQQGFVQLHDKIDAIWKENRNKEYRSGLLIMVDRRVAPDVYMTCESWGYVSERDPVLLVFSDPVDLNLHVEWFPDCRIRTALQLPEGALLQPEDLPQKLPTNDLIVPLNRLERERMRSPLLTNTRFQWVVAGADRDALQRFKDSNDRVVGLLVQ
ncbi:MAG: hypothetical protein AAFX06_03105 [Planctomycetota bacterium]